MAAELEVQIVRLVDEEWPGFVACEFVDAAGKRHMLIDKVPIFSSSYLDSSSELPRRGAVACELLSRWTTDQGQDLVRITLMQPFDVKSNEGLAEFTVLASQVEARASD